METVFDKPLDKSVTANATANATNATNLGTLSSLTTTAKTSAVAAINEIDVTRKDYAKHIKFYYINNNASFNITLNSTSELWLFYRSYQPNILRITGSGQVEVAAGQNQSITVSASNNVVTITNKIGWGLAFCAILTGNPPG